MGSLTSGSGSGSGDGSGFGYGYGDGSGSGYHPQYPQYNTDIAWKYCPHCGEELK